ncbi:MAG TPA: hypothetical protein VGD60_10210 [Candidatus Acidoferrales bacterium]
MELFLNALWFVIALAGLSVWRTRWTRQPREREYSPWHQWTALVCALILLFFMVSLTDDLHSELIVFEEAAGRRHTTCVACPYHPPATHSTATIHVTLNRPILDGESSLIGMLADNSGSRPVDAFLVSFSGRAPPVYSL